MPEAEVTFIGGDYWPTRAGKDRWRLVSNDGREFGVWDKPVYEAVMQHLQVPLVADVSSKQDDRGNWWNTVHAVPSLGVSAAPKQSQPANATNLGVALDLSAIVDVLNRLAVAVENTLALLAEDRLRSNMAPAFGMDDGPQEPDVEPGGEPPGGGAV